MPEETWADVVGFEGRYEVSNEGRVRSVERMVPIGNNLRTVQAKILKQMIHWKGYRYLYLYGANSIEKKTYVHRMVAQAFVANPEGKRLVNHKDLNKGNNNSANLNWMTDSENTQHYYDSRKKKLSTVDIKLT